MTVRIKFFRYSEMHASKQQTHNLGLYFCENAVLGSHSYCALGSNHGPSESFEKSTIDSRNESIVATNAIFIDHVDLNGLWGTLL